MKNERLFEALEKIDSELIDEAAPGNKPPKKKASHGKPEPTKAVTTADGPGSTVKPTPAAFSA